MTLWNSFYSFFSHHAYDISCSSRWFSSKTQTENYIKCTTNKYQLKIVMTASNVFFTSFVVKISCIFVTLKKKSVLKRCLWPKAKKPIKGCCTFSFYLFWPSFEINIPLYRLGWWSGSRMLVCQYPKYRKGKR